MSEENKLVARRALEACSAGSDLAIFDEVMDPAWHNHWLAIPDGVEACKAVVKASWGAFPDMRTTVEDQIAEGDLVVSRTKLVGTHSGDFNGHPPSGKKFEMNGIAIERVVNGKIVETWESWDSLGMLQQIGVIPADLTFIAEE